jgi:hypothetical protein
VKKSLILKEITIACVIHVARRKSELIGSVAKDAVKK